MTRHGRDRPLSRNGWQRMLSYSHRCWGRRTCAASSLHVIAWEMLQHCTWLQWIMGHCMQSHVITCDRIDCLALSAPPLAVSCTSWSPHIVCQPLILPLASHCSFASAVFNRHHGSLDLIVVFPPTTSPPPPLSPASWCSIHHPIASCCVLRPRCGAHVGGAKTLKLLHF